MDLQLEGRTTLVTGSYRGTGLVIASAFLAEGAEVYVHGFTGDQAEAAVDDLGGGHAVHGDINQDRGAEELFEQMPSNLDVLVNNYGTAESGTWEGSGSEDWIGMYQKNVLSAQRMIRHFLPTMRAQESGRIINLGTVGSTSPNSRNPHYYAAKGALATMSVSLAKEVAGSGVRVNLVSPGLILTPEVKQAYMERGKRKGWGESWEEIESHVARDIPIGRIVTREEVAALIVFLASPQADALHGQNIRIDGGALDIVS